MFAGEDALKAGGEKYMPKLEPQSAEECSAYRSRASFFNASARTADGYVGLVFRRPRFIKLPEESTSIGKALSVLEHDPDVQGTSLAEYAKHIVSEVVALGRCGTLIDWKGDAENRVCLSAYATESILNWRVERVGRRNQRIQRVGDPWQRRIQGGSAPARESGTSRSKGQSSGWDRSGLNWRGDPLYGGLKNGKW